MICSVLKIISTEIEKINERYPHFDVVITGDYMSRPVVNKIVKDNFFSFLGGGFRVSFITNVNQKMGPSIRGNTVSHLKIAHAHNFRHYEFLFVYTYAYIHTHIHILYILYIFSRIIC